MHIFDCFFLPFLCLFSLWRRAITCYNFMHMESTTQPSSSVSAPRIIIIGGGFAGIRAALDLARSLPASASASEPSITLIAKNEYFEYYPGLHKIVGVSEHPTYQIPLADIFPAEKYANRIRIIIDTVAAVDAHAKTVTLSGAHTAHIAHADQVEHAMGGAPQVLSADYLILAMGSQTEYFGVQGLPEMAYGFKSVDEAKRLRAHVEDLFQKHMKTDKAETVVGLHMVVVGAGPNGVDLAGELAALDRLLAKKYGIVESFVTLDLIEASSRVLSMMPESVSHRVEKRLRSLGINILCNRDLRKEDSWTVVLADMTLGAKTLIWTAGITTNELVKSVVGFQLGKKNRVAVDEFLQAKGMQNVFCVGDVADTQYSGLAQTALYDAAYVAGVITKKIAGKTFPSYVPKSVAYNIGVGPRWSVLIIGKFVTYGLFAYAMRTVIDIHFFLSILSPKKVWDLYFKRVG